MMNLSKSINMKTNKYKFILITFISISFMSCDKNNDDPNPPYNNSYIQRFTDIDQILVTGDYGILADENKKTVYFGADGAETGDGFYLSVEAKSTKGLYRADAPKSSELYSEYLKYTTLIGDNSFKMKDRFYGVLGFTSTAITDTLMSVVVTCDKAFGREIPANSNLNHLIYVFFDNPYNVVVNNYEDYTGADNYSAKIKITDRFDDRKVKGFPYAFVGGKLSEMEWKSKPFIGNEWLLVFRRKPDVTDTYTFTVKVTNTKGRSFEVYTKPLKLKGLS